MNLSIFVMFALVRAGFLSMYFGGKGMALQRALA